MSIPYVPNQLKAAAAKMNNVLGTMLMTYTIPIFKY